MDDDDEMSTMITLRLRGIFVIFFFFEAATGENFLIILNTPN